MFIQILQLILVIALFIPIKWICYKITEEWGLPTFLNYMPYSCFKCLSFWSLMAIYISIGIMKFTDEDVKLIEKFIDIRNRGYYADSAQLNDVYNRVLEKNVPPTNCGSCMRARISELETALNQFKKTLEVKEEEQPKKTNKTKKK